MWEALLETLKQWYFVIASDKHDEPETWVANGPKAIEAQKKSTSEAVKASEKAEKQEAMKKEIAEKAAAKKMGQDIRWGLRMDPIERNDVAVTDFDKSTK